MILVYYRLQYFKYMLNPVLACNIAIARSPEALGVDTLVPG